MSLYKMNSFPGWYRCVKFDDDLNVESIYDMPVYGRRVGCPCFQGNRETCRHRTMVGIFEAVARVNTGWFLDFDKNTWHKPLEQVFKDDDGEAA
jgi:hypothetical protein